MKYLVWSYMLAAVIGLAIYSANTNAGGSHHNDTINNYYEVTNINYDITNVIEDISDDVDNYLDSLGRDVAGIAALSIAHGSLNFSSTTRKLQLGIGAGAYADQESVVVGVGKVIGNTLITGSMGRARGHTSGGLSITWTLE